MENLRFLKSKETKQIIKILEEQFGVKKELDYFFMMNSEGDIFLINRDIEKIDFEKININNLGLYFGQLKKDQIRLSIEGSQLIGNHAKKGVSELDDGQIRKYISGEDIETGMEDQGQLILKNNKDFFGSSKIKNRMLLNFFPKSRRSSTMQ